MLDQQVLIFNQDFKNGKLSQDIYLFCYALCLRRVPIQGECSGFRPHLPGIVRSLGSLASGPLHAANPLGGLEPVRAPLCAPRLGGRAWRMKVRAPWKLSVTPRATER